MLFYSNVGSHSTYTIFLFQTTHFIFVTFKIGLICPPESPSVTCRTSQQPSVACSACLQLGHELQLRVLPPGSSRSAHWVVGIDEWQFVKAGSVHLERYCICQPVFSTCRGTTPGEPSRQTCLGFILTGSHSIKNNYNTVIIKIHEAEWYNQSESGLAALFTFSTTESNTTPGTERKIEETAFKQSPVWVLCLQKSVQHVHEGRAVWVQLCVCVFMF